jgi:hypothetical protein
MVAAATPGARKPIGQDAAFEIVTEFVLHVARHAASVSLSNERQKRLQVLAHDAMERRLFWTVTLVGSGLGHAEASATTVPRAFDGS